MAYEQFSSFQIGKMLNVSRQAVNQWIDKGYIQSYRTPGGHRRVRRDDLLNFLRTRSIPVPPSLQQFAEGNGTAAGLSSGRLAAARAAEVEGPLIMLVDDDTDFTMLLTSSLKKQFPEAHFQSFDNGFDALVAIGNNPPEVLTIDLKMPNMSGVEICRHLKDNELTRDVTILVITAHDSSEWRDALSQHGVTTVLSKSNPFNEIVDKIAGAIRAELVA